MLQGRLCKQWAADLDTINWPGDVQLGQLNFLDDVAAGAALPQVGDSRAGREFVVWDLSHPTEPKAVQRFTGVKRAIIDHDGFVYVLSDAGLWVLATKPAQEPDPSLYGG